MKKWLFLVFLFPMAIRAQLNLSPAAEIHIVTCGPYQDELYSAFGHSAIRVKDEQAGMDLIYNYGVFDFNQPHFYLNFARGHLRYRLAVMNYRGFVQSYVEENRFVHEQVLNLAQPQKQALFDFLEWNARPENMYYNYDYFYDNCATRVRDAVKSVLGDSVSFDGGYIHTHYSIRDLCHIYLRRQPWGELGIDICLGLPMDKVATPWMYMFLPDYIEQGFDHASLVNGEGQGPLVKQTLLTYEARPSEEGFIWNTPLLFFSAFLLLGIFITYEGISKKRNMYWFDIILFSLTGLLGWLLLILWVATDHKAAAENMNILWAFPLHFPMVLFLLRSRKSNFVLYYFRTTAVVCFLLLVFWFWLPQQLHYSLIPLTMLLLLRSFYIYRSLARQRLH